MWRSWLVNNWVLILRWTIELSESVWSWCASRALLKEWSCRRRWCIDSKSLTSLKDRNLLRVFSRSWSTHSFLFCSSSFFFSRFCRQQRETVRARLQRELDPASFVAFCRRRSVSVGCLVAVVTYQVDLMMLGEDYGALLGCDVLLLVGLHALILHTENTNEVPFPCTHHSQNLEISLASLSFTLQKTPVKLIMKVKQCLS